MTLLSTKALTLRETPTLLGPLERANFNHCFSPEDGKSSSLRNVVFPSFLEYGTIDKFQTPSNTESKEIVFLLYV